VHASHHLTSARHFLYEFEAGKVMKPRMSPGRVTFSKIMDFFQEFQTNFHSQFPGQVKKG
jgi:hypothetical protein